MIMNVKKLQIEQMERKMEAFSGLKSITSPATGWIRAIRITLGISLQQLANHLGITKQSVGEMEKRERDESITIKSLRKAARALNMELVYGFVPIEGTLEALIERKAHELAIQIVSRSSQTMRLEDQENSKERIEKSIEERALDLKSKMPKMLWD